MKMIMTEMMMKTTREIRFCRSSRESRRFLVGSSLFTLFILIFLVILPIQGFPYQRFYRFW
jgi:hypothetical protein